MQVLWTYDTTHGIRQFGRILQRKAQKRVVSGYFNFTLPLTVAMTECNAPCQLGIHRTGLVNLRLVNLSLP